MVSAEVSTLFWQFANALLWEVVLSEAFLFVLVLCFGWKFGRDLLRWVLLVAAATATATATYVFVWAYLHPEDVSRLPTSAEVARDVAVIARQGAALVARAIERALAWLQMVVAAAQTIPEKAPA